MGQIILDRRGDEPVLTFREKRNRKWHVLERVSVPNDDWSAVLTEVDRVFRQHRPVTAAPAAVLDILSNT